jgi:hypothetical protein
LHHGVEDFFLQTIKCKLIGIALLGVFFQPLSAGVNWTFEPQVHGFLSQGYIHSTGRDFLVEGSSNGGSTRLFEGGLNVSNQFLSNLHSSVQMLSREFGEEGNYNVELDFGYIDYQLAPEFGVRLGKVRLPLGLYNEFRDIDASRNSIFLNQAIYAEEFRGFLNAYQGAGLYGGFQHSKYRFLNLEYDVFGGTTSIPDDFFLNDKYEQNLNSPGFEISPDRLHGFKLSWESPLEGLRLGYTYVEFNGSIGLNITAPPPISQFSSLVLPVMDGALDFDSSQSVFSLFYQRGRWSVSAEKMSFLVRSEMTGAYVTSLSTAGGAQNTGLGQSYIGLAFGKLNQDIESWYVQLDYETDFQISPFISYGEFIRDKNTGFAAGSHREDVTIGFRYDMNEWLYAKIENHFIHGYGAINDFDQTTTDNRWNLFVARVAVSF